MLMSTASEYTPEGKRKRATGEHELDKLCAYIRIEHRLAPRKSPQTNGIVERYNGRIEDVRQSHHVRSGEELEATSHRYTSGSTSFNSQNQSCAASRPCNR